ncbi:C45 family peptidase [bacterium]|nr:C45 family peptidase [bacterium]
MEDIKEIPLIEIMGKPRERGHQQGEGARLQIQGMVTAYRTFSWGGDDKKWLGAREKAKRYFPPAVASFPEYIEELQAIAEGANVSFEDVWLLNCFEEVFCEYSVSSCSNVAVSNDRTENGHVLLAHNEDWISVDRNHLYLLRVKPQNQPAFLSLTYGALLANIGFNEEGIGVAINSVYHRDNNLSVPRVVYSRAVLSARTIEEAIAKSTFEDRSGGYNFTLADANGELCCVECSADVHDIIPGINGWIAHTNHYQSSKMQTLEIPGQYAGSNARLNRLRQLVGYTSRELTVQHLQTILADHANQPDSICCHKKPNEQPYEGSQTIASLIMDLNERKMWISLGVPCQGNFKMHDL